MARDPAISPLHLVRVEDEADPRLGPYRNQKDAWLRAERSGGTGLDDGLFLAEGETVVRVLLGSGHEVVSVLCTPVRLAAMRGALAGAARGAPIFVAEPSLLERIIGFDLHRGILALGRRAPAPNAADLIRGAGLLVVCENLTNSDNVGAVFRNVACLAGAPGLGSAGTPAAVLLSPRCCDPLYRKSIRVSMGHALRVPFARLEPWPEALDALAEGGFELLALTPHESAESAVGCKLTPNKRPCLLVGAEGAGLSPQALARSSRRVRIPMAPGADSLNVATALAVALSHLGISGLEGGEPHRPAASP